MTFNLHAATRRELLLASGTLFAWAYLPKVARAEGRDPRLLVIVLRGALDGLAAVAPVGDPDWVALRGDKALTLDGKPAALPLDSFFALNPAMPNLHRLYKSGAATIVHATATPYRERSHFDGQDVLESGLGKPGAADQASGSSARGSSSSPPRPHQQPEPYRAVMESFRAGSRGLPLRPSTYESTAATSSELSRRLGMRAYWYFSKRATAIGSPSASILSGIMM